jgi:hypothetical protein
MGDKKRTEKLLSLTVFGRLSPGKSLDGHEG